ncbi:hypothetical protein I552_10265 [Mycobacterium xenopi 3993]|nr:hypothetical protein I552_10265 [Mycobacterium xenopi 3993]
MGRSIVADVIDTVDPAVMAVVFRTISAFEVSTLPWHFTVSPPSQGCGRTSPSRSPPRSGLERWSRTWPWPRCGVGESRYRRCRTGQLG